MNSSAPPAKRAAPRLAFALLLASLLATVAHAAAPMWRTGWYAQPPLQYNSRQGEVDIVTGLDVELIRAIAREAGRPLQLEEIPWDRHQQQLRSGDRDLAFGATWTAEREKFVRFTAPYRREENALYLRVRDSQRYTFKDPAAFLAQVRAEDLKLGVVKATAYLLPEVDAFVRDPANAAYLVASDTDAANLRALVAGEVDVALMERLAGATLTTQLAFDTIVAEHPVPFGGMEVRAMFSRVSATEKDVEDFNRALQAVQASGEFDRILRGYLLPPLLSIAIGGRWFHWLDILGTVAFAISGVILAHRGRYNLVGAFLLAALPAVGGGLLRDLITGRRPVGVLRSPTPLLIVISVVLVGYLFFKLTDRATAAGSKRHARLAGAFDALTNFFDTVGLAAFIVIGVRVAVEMQCEPLWLWGPLIAILTGAGGGVLRDIVRADTHNSTLKRGFYAEVALVWGLIFSLFLEWRVRHIGMDEVRYGTFAVLVGAFASRMIILNRRWENPFQLGLRHTRPEHRLAALVADLRALVATFPALFEERAGATQPLALEEIEQSHNAALQHFARLQEGVRHLELSQPTPDIAERIAAFRRELDSFAAIATVVHALVREPPFAAAPAQQLHHAVLTSVATLAAAAVDAAKTEDDRATLLMLTHERGSALEAVRQRFATAADSVPPAERTRLLQFIVKFERLVQLLHDAHRTDAPALAA
ncbi:MAG: TRIC cation channel family protein [Verrucomicrobiota bacterium]